MCAGVNGKAALKNDEQQLEHDETHNQPNQICHLPCQ